MNPAFLTLSFVLAVGGVSPHRLPLHPMKNQHHPSQLKSVKCLTCPEMLLRYFVRSNPPRCPDCQAAQMREYNRQYTGPQVAVPERPPQPKPPRPPVDYAKRDAEMLALRAEGMKVAEIGARFGITHQRVAQRLHALGVGHYNAAANPPRPNSCQHCGTSFMSRPSLKQRYCSRRCHQMSRVKSKSIPAAS